MVHRNTPEEARELESAHTNFIVILTIPILLSSIPVMAIVSPSAGLFYMIGIFTLLSIWYAFQDYEGEEIRYICEDDCECEDLTKISCCGEPHSH
jgi:hypothetical protein